MNSAHLSLMERADLLLRTTRFVTLATLSGDGEPWASTVNYVPLLDGPPRLIWYSMREARHSRNIDARPLTTGSLFRTDLGPSAPLGLDGLQFTGLARAVESNRIQEVRDHYYRLNFPDETLRRQWMLPEQQFNGDGPRRFYELTIRDWWLLDVERWLHDKVDQRIALPSPELFAKHFQASATP